MLSKSSLLGLATFAALALPLNAEILSTLDMISMSETFDHIFTGIDKMISDVESYKGGAAGVAIIVADSAAIQRSIESGTAKIRRTPAMGIPDLLTILGPVQVMQSKVGEIVDSLSKKKPELEKAGAAKTILDELTKEKFAADGLVSAIIAGLPLATIVGPVAGPIAKTITDRLDKGIVEWGGRAGQTAKGSAPKSAPKGKGWGGGKGT
jgi:hypothetical protein